MGEQIAPVPIPGASINEEVAGEKPASEKIQKPTPTTYYIKGVPLKKIALSVRFASLIPKIM